MKRLVLWEKQKEVEIINPNENGPPKGLKLQETKLSRRTVFRWAEASGQQTDLVCRQCKRDARANTTNQVGQHDYAATVPAPVEAVDRAMEGYC